MYMREKKKQILLYFLVMHLLNTVFLCRINTFYRDPIQSLSIFNNIKIYQILIQSIFATIFRCLARTNCCNCLAIFLPDQG